MVNAEDTRRTFKTVSFFLDMWPELYTEPLQEDLTDYVLRVTEQFDPKPLAPSVPGGVQGPSERSIYISYHKLCISCAAALGVPLHELREAVRKYR